VTRALAALTLAAALACGANTPTPETQAALIHAAGITLDRILDIITDAVDKTECVCPAEPGPEVEP
jgi:hypothetical protein